MSYPNLEGKHKHKSLINVKDFLKYKKDKVKFPKKIIIVYSKRALNYFKRKYKPKKVFSGNRLGVYQHKNIGMYYNTGVGSPHAVMVFEESIGRGAREFINIGVSGGLQKEGAFLCVKALRDEGTSHHYIKSGKYAYPDKVLTEKLAKSMNKVGLDFSRGTTWTIDAPYRETKKEVQKYKKEGISTVEMEASALFVVAKVRKVKIASAFVVSDILGETWTPKFDAFDVKKGIHQLVDSAVECLK